MSYWLTGFGSGATTATLFVLFLVSVRDIANSGPGVTTVGSAVVVLLLLVIAVLVAHADYRQVRMKDKAERGRL